ncbi:MAG: transcription termination/antitermination protein NusA [Spirochaetales bacterium]|nr:transcription termination/antitermination protein NusA [Spirochaetales bacterium]
MSSDISMAIRQLIQERGISEDLVLRTIEESLLAAYKRKFGTSDNAVVRFNDDNSEVSIFAQKQIVDDVIDPVSEIDLEEALTLNSECEIGDELLIEINPKDFDRISVQSARQKTKQKFREIQKDTLYSEYQDKVGEMIIGYYQRERNGNIFVDLGKVEGILPKKYQSPREVYHLNDRIKALIFEVNKASSGLQIVLSRTHPEFVKRIFELEVPEIYDHTVEIFKIVREPGYRTKIAVYSNRDDVDPVGACVGLKGVRIQAIVKELEGEKIDILRYDIDPRAFIKNALSPAEVMDVVILDEAKKQALVIVQDANFALAIGKQGLNVRLANRLVDWNIDVKTEAQFAEMDISLETKKAVSALFSEGETDVSREEISSIAELPGLDSDVVSVLKENNVDLIEDLITLTKAELLQLDGLNNEQVEQILKVVDENVEIVEEGKDSSFVTQSETDVAEEEESDEEAYECPECGAAISIDMSNCPSCGIGLSFEEIEEEPDDQEEPEE